jgi:hypothetical protein
MKSKLLKEKPKTAQISTKKWIRILPDKGKCYQLDDALQECFIGSILFDADDNWIYDGNVLNVEEQEDVAGLISGNHKEMNDLITQLQVSK